MLNHHFPLYLMSQYSWMSIKTKYHNGHSIGTKNALTWLGNKIKI
jgi:hypothetical protein